MNTDAYQTLIPLFEMKSNAVSVIEFHKNVNSIFHDIESKYYDSLQKSMWKSLPDQLDILLRNVSKDFISGQKNLKLLDVGCGTGLATSILLKTELGTRIDEIALIDTSSGMLKKALKRSKKWNKKVQFFNSQLEAIDREFDIIIISSVLHHIPDLDNFMLQIENRLKNGGYLITLQDPLAEAVKSRTYIERCKVFSNTKLNPEKYSISNVVEKLVRKISGIFKADDYIEQVNNKLLSDNVIHTRLSHGEMWSVTDIHVEGLPFSNKCGISITKLQQSTVNLKLLNFITYCFFGVLADKLPPTLKIEEARLTNQNDKQGRNFGSIWKKN